MTPYSGYNGFKSARYNVRDQQLTSARKLLNERKFMKRLKRYMGYAFHETECRLEANRFTDRQLEAIILHAYMIALHARYYDLGHRLNELNLAMERDGEERPPYVETWVNVITKPPF